MAELYNVRLATMQDLKFLPDVEHAANILFAPYLDMLPPCSGTVVDLDALGEKASSKLLWVAVNAQDTPVGFAFAGVVDNLVHLEEVDVHIDHARRGIGTRLVEAVCHWAQEHGYKAITLTTFLHVPFNAPWYAKLGFRSLDGDEMTPGLAGLLAREAAQFPNMPRTAMRKELVVSAQFSSSSVSTE